MVERQNGITNGQHPAQGDVMDSGKEQVVAKLLYNVDDGSRPNVLYSRVTQEQSVKPEPTLADSRKVLVERPIHNARHMRATLHEMGFELLQHST